MRTWFLVGLFLLPIGNVAAELVWRSEPTVMTGYGGNYGHQRRLPELELRGANQNVSVHLWTPTLEQRSLSLNKPDNKVFLRPTGSDNYHLLFALQRNGDTEEVGLRYVYLNGKPSGQSPSTLTSTDKTTLEIEPFPLPREHWRYLSGRKAEFRLKFKGKVLPNSPFSLVTTNGTLIEGKSDGEGKLTVELPDDFRKVVPGREKNRPAEFIVRAALHYDDVNYHTTFSAAYSVNPSHWQSSWLALLSLGSGFITGMMIIKRSQTREKA